MRNVLPIALIVGFAIALPVAASAQDTLEQTPAASTKVERPQAEPVKAAPAPEKVPALSKPINIQIEVTLTDQLGSAAPIKKIVSLITSDGSMGRIRSGADGFDPELGKVLQVVLNVDAMPRLREPGELIQLNLTIEYKPLKSVIDGRPSGTSPTALNQSLTVVMTSGKPMIVSQAADPANDRKIVVEAKATILK